MAEPVLGDFQPAGLAGLDEVGHIAGGQGMLSGVRYGREGGADAVAGHGMQYRALERMVADGRRIVEADGDVNHA